MVKLALGFIPLAYYDREVRIPILYDVGGLSPP